MNVATVPDWHKANQSYLAGCLAVIYERLNLLQAEENGGDANSVSSAESSSAEESSAEESSAENRLSAALKNRDQLAGGLQASSALHALSSAFGLSGFEEELLLLCAGVELEARFMPLCAALQSELRKSCPTFSLAMRALPEAHWSAFLPAGPLRRWRLIEIGSGDSLIYSPLRIDERVLHYLAGLSYLDDRLQVLAEQVPVNEPIPASHRLIAERIVQILSKEGQRALPIIQVCGEDGEANRYIAARASADLGMGLYSMKSEDIPALPHERELLARLWEREAFLSNAALILDCSELDRGEKMNVAVSFLENMQSPVLTSCRQPLILHRRSSIKLDVSRAKRAEQREIWAEALGPLVRTMDGRLDGLVAEFNLGMMGIQSICSDVGERGDLEGEELYLELRKACCSEARPSLEDLAQRIEPAAGWDDLVLPPVQQQILREIGVHVRQRATVYDSWGFAGKGSRGLGISALFAGDSGTGKTMAAEVLASELRLDLYRIDLSQVVSKYIGETEKNLRKVFDAAEGGGAILLFDEADALFGKRSEVKDSHDRYANIEISYLLQRMEAYRGLAILTTNMKSALDRAFLRRIRFVVQFPFPDASNRARIWERIYPRETPTLGLDYERLSRLNVAGGNIRNIALYAAFLAADSGEPVKMQHLLRAARVEYAKMERAPTEGEIGGWV
jgi:hypothetical protein